MQYEPYTVGFYAITILQLHFVVIHLSLQYWNIVLNIPLHYQEVESRKSQVA